MSVSNDDENKLPSHTPSWLGKAAGGLSGAALGAKGGFLLGAAAASGPVGWMAAGVVGVAGAAAGANLGAKNPDKGLLVGLGSVCAHSAWLEAEAHQHAPGHPFDTNQGGMAQHSSEAYVPHDVAHTLDHSGAYPIVPDSHQPDIDHWTDNHDSLSFDA